jgi:hypothetical protein
MIVYINVFSYFDYFIIYYCFLIISIKNRILYYFKLKMKNMDKDKYDLSLNEQELQTIMDSLSNTIFNEEIKEDARKSAKDLFIKLQKDFPILK